MDRDETIEYQAVPVRPYGVLVESPYCTVLTPQTNDLIWKFCFNNGCFNLCEPMLLKAAQEQFDFEQYRNVAAARNAVEDRNIVFTSADCRRWRSDLEQPTLPWN